MTEFELPEILRQHRPLLLALEAIGWLHMTGKAKVDFLYNHGGRKNNYKYEEWYKSTEPQFPWNTHLSWVKEKFSLDKDAWPDEFTAFIRHHTNKDKGMLGLLQAGHAMASGIEKQSFPKNTVSYLGQDVTHMWLSTAFGKPDCNLLAKPPGLLTDEGWKDLVERIGKLLTKLSRLGRSASPNNLDCWWRWRNSAVGSDGWLRRTFSSTLAETRLPNNDVTLFDQSYVAAALFKSAAAGAILEGGAFPWCDKSLKQQTRWRLLTIGIGTDHLESRAVKIGDWTGARQTVDDFFIKVSRLVEIDLAVGALLYQDGEICLFSFPGERFGDDTRELKEGDLQIAAWQSRLTELIDGYARDADFEIPVYCSISEPSRALVAMTKQIRKARETMAVPHFRNWQIPGQDLSDGHVCPVCLMRCNNSGTDKQRPCDPCRKRRTHRLDMWLNNESESDSIWIGEIADANDRAALVTMSLDIEPWLDGTRLDSLRTQAIVEWATRNSTRKNSLPKDYDELVEWISTAFGTNNQARKARSLIQKKIAPGLKDGDKDVPWNEFYKLMVEDRADAPKWDDIDESERAKWLAHQFFRKLASPGRIYRFQRQAEDFFRVLLAEFREVTAADQNSWRTRRVLLKATSGSWEDRHPYAGRVNGTSMDLLYSRNLGGFVTIFNLSRILDKTQCKDIIKDKTIPLKDDDNNPVDRLKIKAVEKVPNALNVYHPMIPLELSPMRFRVLLPLETASTCVDRAVCAWSDQFARVWDRLPLRIGVAAFPRTTPFQAVIEAARTIEDDLNRITQPETRRVTTCTTREGVTALISKSLHDHHEMLQAMPIHFPDRREDVFYPYFAVEDKQLRFPLDFKHPSGRIYRHAKELQVGDGILVYPSLIATIFLDDTAKRFEPLEAKPLTQWRRMRELWSRIDRAVPSRTALRGAWSQLTARREAWKGPDGAWMEGGKQAWLDLARAVFHTHLGLRGACLETLVQAAGDGLLDWSLEWHITVLKKQVLRGDR
jgi:CRISPR-associated Csx11 family protein